MISLSNVMGIIRRWKNSIISLRLGFLKIPHKNIWVSWGVLFKGLGVQKGTQTPCWLRPCRHLFLTSCLWSGMSEIYASSSCHIYKSVCNPYQKTVNKVRSSHQRCESSQLLCQSQQHFILIIDSVWKWNTTLIICH